MILNILIDNIILWKHILQSSSSFFLGFYRSLRPITATTIVSILLYLLHILLRFLRSGVSSVLVLSTHLYLGCPRGLLVSDFHLVIDLIIPSDLHTCPTQLILLLFRDPKMVGSLYRPSNILQSTVSKII